MDRVSDISLFLRVLDLGSISAAARSLDLSVAVTSQRYLVSEGFDLAIRIGALGDSSLVARRIANTRRVLCASPAYLRRRDTPRLPGELATHDCLLLFGAKGRQDTWNLLDASGQGIDVRVRGRLESNRRLPGGTLR